MIDTEIYKNPIDDKDMCKTFSTDNLPIKQIETGYIYDDYVLDVIAGYYENGKPYSRFTYTETDKPIPEEPEEADNG